MLELECLGVGVKFLFPEGTILYPSRNAKAFPETPHFFEISQLRDSTVVFVRPEKEHVRKMIVFAPKGVGPRDLVEVEWAEGNCACIRIMQKAKPEYMLT